MKFHERQYEVQQHYVGASTYSRSVPTTLENNLSTFQAFLLTSPDKQYPYLAQGTLKHYRTGEGNFTYDYNDVTFEVFTVVQSRILIFWTMKLCRWVRGSQRQEGTSYLNLQRFKVLKS